MRIDFVCKMKTLLRLVFEVNCYAKEPYKDKYTKINVFFGT